MTGKEEFDLKILSVVIPCYNSEAYMRKAINSALSGGDDVEIIIVNDGSTDNTKVIADEFAKGFPDIVKVINKENGGHGDAVNVGLENATGEYFKVVDSDDWLGEEELKKVLKVLKNSMKANAGLDMLLTNFIYDKAGAHHKKVMHYHHALPEKKILGWDEKIKFNKFQYILMHSVIYRTKMLIECGLVLPKHTFYVDNIFIFKPLPYVNKIYYLNVNLYHYFIGRNDQSVNEKVMISRLDQQIRVNKLMIDIFVENKPENKHLYKCMFQSLDMIMCVSSVMAILSKDKKNLEKKAELWEYLKEKDEGLYKKLRTTIFGIWMNLPGRGGRFLSKTGYKLMQKIFGFN